MYDDDAPTSWLRREPSHEEPRPASDDAQPSGEALAWLREGATTSQPLDHAAPNPVDAADLLTKDLTEPQRQAVLHTEGPLLVLAAAGSGKTRVITRRIAYLLSLGVPPWSILALTFTNKAAGEMRERVHHLLGGSETSRSRGLTITTFHALCARLLRKHAEHAGLKPDYTIYDSGDQQTLLKKCIESLQLSTSNFPPRSVLGAISNAKNQLLTPAAYAQHATDFSGRHIAKIYSSYERGLRAANAVDFDDLLLLTALMLRDKPEVRDDIRQRYQYILVDEYQDTNQAQFTIASMIAGNVRGVRERLRGDSAESDTQAPNICVVGDPDQAIYGWRGADISNILDFEQSYPGCRVITLGENFRSSAPILRLADSLIRHNKVRKHKDLFTKRPGGDKAQAILCRDERHEGAVVVDWLKSRREADPTLSWKDMAVFYRTNALSRVLEESFRAAGVPYTIARGTAFYDREEIKNALAYLRVVANQSDDVSLLRIINTPSRGISDATVDKLDALAQQRSLPVLAAMRTLSAGDVAALGLTTRAMGAISAFVQRIDAWTGSGHLRTGEDNGGSLAELVDRVLKDSGLESHYAQQAKKTQSEADEARVDNLAELVSSARQFELEFDPAGDALADPASIGTPLTLLPLLRAYLESVSLVADADAIDPATGSVTLMTLHAAKGLEFPVVAMVGLEESLLPHARAVTSATEAEMEEERRLCFVGITRAMRSLLMTAAKVRTHRGIPERTIPSRFLSELDATQLAVSDQSGATFEAGDEYAHDDEAREFVDRGTRTSTSQRSGSASAGGFRAGDSVRHPQFGVGTVVSISPGAQARVTVRFKDVGQKTLVLAYARLVKASGQA